MDIKGIQGLKRFASRLGRYVNRYLLGGLDFIFAPAADRPLRYPPIFILGAPRSGSTLIMQVLTDAFDFGYISNAHARWFGCPALAERVWINSQQKPPSDYQSTHGITTGGAEPSECGDWWYRFFRRRPSYIESDEVDDAKMTRFRQSIASLTNAFDKPLIFKNLYASYRINAIARYIPEAVFIVIHRDYVDSAHSILQTRYKYFEDYNHWWSMDPPNVAELKVLPAHEQVIEQIRQTHRIIQNDICANQIPGNRCFHIEYESFCRGTQKVLDEFDAFLKDCGCAVRRIAFTAPPFSIRESVEIPTSVYSELLRYAQKH